MADTFTFVSSGLEQDVFRVLRFTGTEAVSECYSFDIELLALKEFDVKSLYDTDATFSVARSDGTSTSYRGRVASIGVERMMDGEYFKCRARLVPHLWFYTLRKSCKAYVGKTIRQIIDAELKENGEGASGGFMSQFDQLPETSFPLVVKYHETPLEFIARLLQRECLYYYFLSDGGMDTLKFSSDVKLKSNEVLSAKVINNLSFSSLGEQDERILFKSLHMEQAMRAEPLNLYAHDGNPDSVETLHGIGRTAIEKSMLGPLRDISNTRQSQDAQPAVRYNMATSVRGSRVGIVHDGLRALSLRHDGDQSAAVLESLGLPTEPNKKDFYRNQGLWMPEGDAYIPQWNLEAPRIANATLTGFTTRINSNGTYDVKCHSIDTATDLPNVRMSFPFAGKKGEASGMHLPLVDGTEVLLEFLEGDPDRPVIMGSLYNSSVGTPVTAMNKTDHIIYTPQDNRICMHDGATTMITMESPDRIEAFSCGECFEIDSNHNYIKGNSTNLIALHAGAGHGGGADNVNGTGVTSLVLNGSDKAVGLQASDALYIRAHDDGKTIKMGTNNTNAFLSDESPQAIALTANNTIMGLFIADSDLAALITKAKTRIDVSGNSDSITLTTAGGAKAVIDGKGDSITLELSDSATKVVLEPSYVMITDGTQEIVMDDGNTNITSPKKITIEGYDVDVISDNDVKKIVLGHEFEMCSKKKFDVNWGSTINIFGGIKTNAFAGFTVDLYLSGGLKVGYSKKLAIANTKETFNVFDKKSEAKKTTYVLNVNMISVKKTYNIVNERTLVFNNSIVAGNVFIV